MRKLMGKVPLLHLDNLWGQGLRFAITGVVVSIIYIGITTIFAVASQLPFQVGLGIGWCAAVTVHFTLQRGFVWAHEEGFALPFRHQVGRYLLTAGSQFGVTAAGTAVLPPLLGLSAEAIYLGMALLITGANFLVFRHGVFHSGPAQTEPPPIVLPALPRAKVA